VLVVDITNGSRLETYTIAGERGSGIICLNGAAAKLINKGDTVIIMAFADMDEKEAKEYKPTVVFVDDENKVKSIKNYEKHGRLID
jgi:aspartate 1-decarboxylase